MDGWIDGQNLTGCESREKLLGYERCLIVCYQLMSLSSDLLCQYVHSVLIWHVPVKSLKDPFSLSVLAHFFPGQKLKILLSCMLSMNPTFVFVFGDLDKCCDEDATADGITTRC